LLQYYIWIIECIVRFKNTHRSELVQSIQSCGIHFQIWEGRKTDGFGDSFKNIEWTILNGSNMTHMLKDLLDVLEGKYMLERFLIFLTKSKVIKLWRDCYQFYAIMKNLNPPKGDIHSFQWVND
jgi:hypothetical protein